MGGSWEEMGKRGAAAVRGWRPVAMGEALSHPPPRPPRAPPGARIHGALMAVVVVVAVAVVAVVVALVAAVAEVAEVTMVVVWTMTMISAIYADEGVLVYMIIVFVARCKRCTDGETK